MSKTRSLLEVLLKSGECCQAQYPVALTIQALFSRGLFRCLSAASMDFSYLAPDGIAPGSPRNGPQNSSPTAGELGRPRGQVVRDYLRIRA